MQDTISEKKRFRSAGIRSSLVVSIIAENELAVAYLADIIQRDSSIRYIHGESALGPREGSDNQHIFIVDECGLQPPISLYLKTLRQIHASAKYIVLGKTAGSAYIAELLAFGMHGFLTHHQAAESLLAAIDAVASGRLWIPSQALELSVKRLHQSESLKFSKTGTITRREYEILQLVQARLTNREIAKLIQIRESTVKFHISNIFAKLQISSRRELARTAWPPNWAQLSEAV